MSSIKFHDNDVQNICFDEATRTCKVFIFEDFRINAYKNVFYKFLQFHRASIQKAFHPRKHITKTINLSLFEPTDWSSSSSCHLNLVSKQISDILNSIFDHGWSLK